LNFNIFNIIIVSGVVHGIIFSSIVFANKKYITNNTVYLGLVVLFLSLSNFQNWLLDTQIVNDDSIYKLTYLPWQWLILPMFYFYVFKFLGKQKMTFKTKVFLISPFFILFILHTSIVLYNYFVNHDFSKPSHFKRGFYLYSDYLSFIFNLLIMYFTYTLIISYEKNNTFDITWVKSETNWLKKLIYIGVFACLCWVFAITKTIIYDLNNSHLFYPLWIGISILIYLIGYAGLSKSKELRNRIELRKKRIENIKQKQNKSSQKSETFDKIKYYIEEKKSYLNPNLSLNHLSDEFNLSEGYISQIVNKNLSKNLTDYINSLRVEDAKKMLTDSDYDKYTILSIGLESGFNSKSSFYTTFKKLTGQTPLEYKKSIQNH